MGIQINAILHVLHGNTGKCSTRIVVRINHISGGCGRCACCSNGPTGHDQVSIRLNLSAGGTEILQVGIQQRGFSVIHVKLRSILNLAGG